MARTWRFGSHCIHCGLPLRDTHPRIGRSSHVRGRFWYSSCFNIERLRRCRQHPDVCSGAPPVPLPRHHCDYRDDTYRYNGKGTRACTPECTCAGAGQRVLGNAGACACKAACTWAYNGTRACTCADDFHVAIPATNVQQSTVIITSMATYSSAYQLPARRICAGGVSDLACEPPSAVRIQLARWQVQVTQVWVVRSKTIDPTAHGGRPNTYDPRVTSA